MVILELIHAKSPTEEGQYLLDKNQSHILWRQVSHDNCADRMAKSRRRFNQISALSTFDGRIEAYHGVNG